MSKSKQRRLLVVLLAVALIISAFFLSTTAVVDDEPVEELECYEHGDVNGDGVVDRRDAVYVLYRTFYPDRYPTKQDCDFEKDDAVNRLDAIYLLYASFGMSSKYTLNGTVHSYYDPVWTWNTEAAEVTAQVTFRCGCGQTHTVTTQEPDGVTVTAGTVTAATCVAPGAQEYTAQVTYDNKTYTDTTSVVIPANEGGHNMVGVQGCDSTSVCDRCGFTLPALGHNWEQTGAQEATCTADAKLIYTCGRCGETDEVEQAGTAGCKLAYFGEKQGANEYQLIKQYQCSVCRQITDGESYCKHNYIAKIALEATCSSKGSKTLTCSACGDVQTEEIDKNDSHTWVKGDTNAAGATEYSCACGATKSVVEVQKDAAVPAEALKNNELQLENNTSVALDQEAAEKLDTTKKIVISVEEVDVDTIDMSESEKAQVGDNAVYDFTMKYEGADTPISDFEGFVTVRLPYTLKDGDNADSIDVWYIADDGSVECVKGVYSNDYVTFQTDHFSYYTVTRLTPAQRCSVYGHIMVTSEKKATCTADGYTTVFCQRCGEVESNVVAPMLGHDYQTIENKAAACGQTGLKKEQCLNCKEIKSSSLPALGHDMKVDEAQSTEASCTAPGKTVSVCARGCGHKTEEELPQLKHSYKLKETVAATCGENGYEKYACENCGGEEKRNETTALGHKWNAENALWQWNEDHTKATVTLTCEHKDTHTKTLTAVVTKKDEGSVCLGGAVTYTATASYNQVTYTDQVTDQAEGPGHKPAGEMQFDDTQHYQLCSVCGEPVGAANHTWGEQTVVTEATCTKAGKATVKCTACEKTKEVTLPATGVHNYVNGVCADCGFVEGSCNHRRLYETEIDLSKYGVCGGTVSIKSCECGQVSRLDGYKIACKNLEIEEKETENGYQRIATCSDCGFVYRMQEEINADEENCMGQWVDLYRFSKGDTLIAEVSRSYGQFAHPVIKVQEYDLKTLGMCGGKARLETCPCGLRSYYYFDEEDGIGCEFTVDEETETVSCSVCGVIAVPEMKTETKGCITTERQGVTYMRDGQKLLTLADVYVMENHEIEIVELEAYGDSCEDGLYVVAACTECGKTTEEYMDNHMAIHEEKIDTTGTGFCSEAIVLNRCNCGEFASYYFEGDDYEGGHSWNYQGEKDNSRSWICNTCGYTHTEQWTKGEKDEYCERYVTSQHTFADEAGHSFRFETKDTESDHNLKTEVELLGTSCEDGVTEYERCQDCDYENEWTYQWHNTRPVESYDLSAYGFCGGTISLYRCACGQEDYRQISQNSCHWIPACGDENFTEYYCEVCGIVWRNEYTLEDGATSCETVRRSTNTYLKDDEVLCVIEDTEHEFSHSFIYELTLNPGATSCEGGYRYEATCIECGDSHSGSGNGCTYYAVAREILPIEGLCGQLEKITFTCACGSEERVTTQWIDDECWYNENYWSEELNTWVNICEKCGSQYAEQRTEEAIEGQTCKFKIATIEYYLDKDGKLIAPVETSTYGYRHRYVYSYVPYGETCDQGYRYSYRCLGCGESGEGEDYGCVNRVVSREIVVAEGLCGQLELVTRSCACGQYGNTQLEWVNDDRCDFSNSYWSDEYNMWVYTCSVCGATKGSRSESEPVEGTTCEYSEKQTVHYWDKDGNELLNTVIPSRYFSHNEIYMYTLLGETCADGWEARVRCADCDWVQSDGYYTGNSCSKRLVGRETVYESDCGPIYLETYSCACGKLRSYACRDGSCDWEHTQEKDGASYYTCRNCQLVRQLQDTEQRLPGTCIYENTLNVKYLQGEQVVATVDRSWSEQRHVEICSFRLLGETCADGFYTTVTCAFCDYYYANNDSNSLQNHDTYYRIGFVEMPEGSCGGDVELFACPCGQSGTIDRNLNCSFSYSNEEETDENGIVHNYSHGVCAACGLTMDYEYYWAPGKDSCHINEYRNYTFKLGDWEKTLSSKSEETDHNWENVNCQLKEGSVTCEDGIWVFQRCADCGKENTYSTTGHETYKTEAIDLSQYGSVCGGSLNKVSCACGAYNDYVLSADLQCDLDVKMTENWIEGTVDDAQETSHGWMTFWTHANVHTCAVTDPACGLQLRKADYWLKEGCSAVHYVTWQLGYDLETDTWQKEVTVATGERYAYHDYERTTSKQELDSGYVWIYTDLCKDCGSSYTANEYYNADDELIKTEQIAVNTLNNGENQRRTYTTEYLQHMDYRYEKMWRSETVYSDGSIWWQQYEYTYDFASGCNYTFVETNSDGHYGQGSGTNHRSGYEQIWLKENTCSQFGKYIERWTCHVCGQIEQEYTYERDPIAHSWYWDNNRDAWVCTYCDLESANGASGDIVLEDLTEQYTDGNYVIGYWNRGEVTFNPYVSLVLYDAQSDNDELVLTGIDFTYLTVDKDGICGLSFSQDAVAQAAAAAIENAGYTGEYAVRISFVPTTGDNTLDYAVTFDTLTA